MKVKNHIVESASEAAAVEENPVMEADAVLTPKAEAKVANQLPKVEQLEHFEEDLEEHDPGNQSA